MSNNAPLPLPNWKFGDEPKQVRTRSKTPVRNNAPITHNIPPKQKAFPLGPPLALPVMNFGDEQSPNPLDPTTPRTPISHEGIRAAVRQALADQCGPAVTLTDVFDKFVVYNVGASRLQMQSYQIGEDGTAELARDQQEIKEVTKYRSVKTGEILTDNSEPLLVPNWSDTEYTSR